MPTARTPSTTRARALAAVAALAAALPAAAALAPRADAAGLQYARFWATYTAERSTAWGVPRWQGHQDCWHTWWYDGDGRDVETHTTTLPIRVLAAGSGRPSASVLFTFRSWDRFAQSGRGMPATAQVTRRERNGVDWTAGTCGVRGEIVGRDGELRMTPDPPLPDDCGRRSAAMETTFDVVGDRLHLNAALGPRQEISYRSCETKVPAGMGERGLPDAVTAAFDARELFDPSRRVLRLRASRRWAEVIRRGLPGQGYAAGRVTWTLTLRRARGSAAPRR